MIIPDGYTEPEVLASIERIVKFLSPLFTFGYYDKEDIAQEGRIYGLEALQRYKPGLGSLDTFLKSHIKNRLLNLRRDKLVRVQVPCQNCEYYTNPNTNTNPNPNTNTTTDPELSCLQYPDKASCERWNLWSIRNITKRSLMEPSYEDMGSLVEDKYVDVSESYCQSELVQIVDSNLPISMRKDFRKILEGATVPKFRHTKLLTEIKEILSRNYDGKDWF